MDRITIAATVVAVMQSAQAVNTVTRALQAFRNAPAELSAINNEARELTSILSSVALSLEHASIATVPEGEMLRLREMIERVNRHLVQLTEELKLSMDFRNGEIVAVSLTRVKWLRSKKRVSRMYEELRALNRNFTMMLYVMSYQLNDRDRVRILGMQSQLQTQIQSDRTTNPTRARALSQDAQAGNELVHDTNFWRHPEERRHQHLNSKIESSCSYQHNRPITLSSPHCLSLVTGRFFLRIDQKRCKRYEYSPFMMHIQWLSPSWYLRHATSIQLTWSTRAGISLSFALTSVVPFNHDIWRAIRDGNVDRIRRLFSTKEISPYDCGSINGRLVGFLSYSVEHYQSDVTRFLADVCYSSDDRFCHQVSASLQARRKLFGAKNLSEDDWTLLGSIATTETCNDHIADPLYILYSALSDPDDAALKHALLYPSFSINSLGQYGYSPLHLVVLQRRRSHLDTLCMSGADVNIPDALGCTPLHLSVHLETFNESITAFLLDHGANPNAIDFRGRTPLHVAIASGCVGAVALLISAGADPNISDFVCGETPLQLLMGVHPVLPTHYEMLEALWDAGADLEQIDSSGTTALLSAIKNPDGTGLFKWLLGRGARIDQVDDQGRSVFHLAAIWGDVELAGYLRTILVDTVVNPDQKDNHGYRPADLLRQRTSDPDSWYTTRSCDGEEVKAFTELFSDWETRVERQRLSNCPTEPERDIPDDLDGLEEGEQFWDAHESQDIEDSLLTPVEQDALLTHQNDTPLLGEDGDTSEAGSPVLLPSPMVVSPETHYEPTEDDEVTWNLEISRTQNREDAEDSVSDAGSDSTLSNAAPSSVSSATLVNGPSALQAALRDIASLLFQHPSILQYLEVAANDDSIGLSRFDRYMRSALRGFAADFATESTDPDAAYFVSKYAGAIAMAITIASVQRAGSDVAMKRTEVSDDDGFERGYGSSEEEGSDVDSKEMRKEDLITEHTAGQEPNDFKIPDFSKEELQGFIINSAAFRLLIIRLREIAHPSFLQSARRLIKRTMERNGAAEEKSHLHDTDLWSLIAELDHSKPSDMKIDTTPGISIADRMKLTVESATRDQWNWSPFSPPRRPLLQGQVRLLWTCSCGDTRCENVPEVFGREMVRLLNHHALNGDYPASASTSIFHNENHSGNRDDGVSIPKQSSDPAPPSTLGSDGASLQSTEHSAEHDEKMIVEENHEKDKYIFLLVSSDKLRLRQLDSKNQCTRKFAEDLQAGYYQLRGFWRYWLSIYTFDRCDFVKSEKFCPSEFSVRGFGLPEKDPDDPDSKDYYYSPRPANNLCPISPEEFRHIYKHYRKAVTVTLDNKWMPFTMVLQAPYCWPRFSKTPPPLLANVQQSKLPPDTVPKIPQRFRYFDEVGGAREKLWGLHAREKRSAVMVSLYILLALMPSFAFSFVYLFGLGGKSIDLQNAFTVFTLSLTTVSLFIGWLVK